MTPLDFSSFVASCRAVTAPWPSYMTVSYTDTANQKRTVIFVVTEYENKFTIKPVTRSASTTTHMYLNVRKLAVCTSFSL